MFRRRFWVALVLTVPTVVWGHMLASATGWHAPAFPGSTWIPPVLGTAVFAYGGWPFVQGAAREVRARLPGMMTLISLAIGVAFAFSLAVTVGHPGMPLWEELSTLVAVMLLGHWIEMRSISQAQVVLVRSDPRDVPRIIALSRATYRKMIQNLWWAAGYNVAAIPLAAGVLARWGILLAPAIGAILMSLSTVIVAVNAQLLRRAEL